MGGSERRPVTGADLRLLSGLGFSGYYLASFLDFSGLQYISANLERLILYLNPDHRAGDRRAEVSYAGHRQTVHRAPRELSRCLRGVWTRRDCRWATHRARLSARIGSAVSYALYLVYSGQALKRLGPHSHHGGGLEHCLLDLALRSSSSCGPHLSNVGGPWKSSGCPS